eukprot:TRINITY_DN1517_c4_g1_i1.p1 TRINITY_DN1517_c4_g1~~TRINITY_DN1517_c4_g1_i1.p1  ORF type:complete len:172 (+),score=35.83 TRINITY_DN1517_c4_g1_i1:41-517(+)
MALRYQLKYEKGNSLGLVTREEGLRVMIEKVVWGTPGKLSAAAEQRVRCGELCSLGGKDITTHADIENVLNESNDGDELMLIVNPIEESEENDITKPSFENLQTELSSQFQNLKSVPIYSLASNQSSDATTSSRLSDLSFSLSSQKMCMQGRRTLLTT